MKINILDRLGWVWLVLLTGLASCGNPPETTDPMARLNALKEDRARIESEIASLEKEMEASGLIDKKLRMVSLEEVKKTHFRHFIDLQGKVEADQSVVATAQIPGALKRVFVRNGDMVRAGQLLAELDDAVILKSIAEIEGQLVVAKDLYARQQSLWEQQIGSEVQLIQAKNTMESLERSLATAQANWDMTKIKAPTSGVVDYVNLKVGEAIAPGVPLCTIVNLSKLKMVGAVTEAYVSKVKKGDKVQLYFPDSGQEITSTVTFVSKIIMPNTRTFSVECALPAGDFRVNQIAVMKIVDYQNPEAIVVPVNVIQTASDGDFVLVAEPADEPGHAQVRKALIQQGRAYNGMVEILSGLTAGDRMIASGFQDINAGELVHY